MCLRLFCLESAEKKFAMTKKNSYLSISFAILLLFGLYMTRHYSYLLFHTLTEMFGIVVACSIFILVWNSRRFVDNNYLLFIGIAYLFIAGLDLIHTLAYDGMGVFKGYGTNLATQLWISARYVESISLLVAPLFIGRRLKTNFIMVGYSVGSFLLIASVFYWKIFPDCFVEGTGLTAFKKISEYIICLILLASIVLLSARRLQFDTSVIRLLIASIFLTMASELAFTLYMHAYGLLNLMGHYLKIVSFYLIYKAILETGLRKPYALLFRNLKQSQEALQYRLAFEELVSDISARFISMTSEKIDQGVEEALGKIGRFADADGGYVFLFSGDMKRFSMTHLWRNENLSTEKRNLQDLDASSMPWWTEQLLRHKPLVVPAVSDLPRKAAVEKSVIASQGIQSLVDVPMVHVGRLIGFLGFSCVRNQRDWTDDEIALLQLVGQVITSALQRKNAEARITRAKKEWEQTFDAVPDLISILDNEYRIVQANKALAGKLGCSAEELIGRSCYEVTHGTDKPPAFCLHAKVLTDGNDHVAEVHEDRLGGDFLVTVSPLYDQDGKLRGSVHVARDITRRKQAEKALQKAHEELEKRVQQRTAQLKRLSAQLLTVQEDERKRIARELHDSIGQSLAAIKFGAESAMEHMLGGTTKAGMESLEALIPVVKQASEEVRRIHMDLRPAMLDDLGILKTISWFCREFTKLYPQLSIQREFGIQEGQVPDRLKIVIFRLLQEALNNVVKHGKAELVSVSLKGAGNRIELLVADNGKGFDADQVQAQRSLGGGFGLHSMNERAELSGGSLFIESNRGAGTIVRVSWPR
jgi:PAS domain S-box-containing protein